MSTVYLEVYISVVVDGPWIKYTVLEKLKTCEALLYTVLLLESGKSELLYMVVYCKSCNTFLRFHVIIVSLKLYWIRQICVYFLLLLWWYFKLYSMQKPSEKSQFYKSNNLE